MYSHIYNYIYIYIYYTYNIYYIYICNKLLALKVLQLHDFIYKLTVLEDHVTKSEKRTCYYEQQAII